MKLTETGWGAVESLDWIELEVAHRGAFASTSAQTAGKYEILQPLAESAKGVCRS